MNLFLSSVFRSIAPFTFGTLFTWSLGNVNGVTTNQHPLGFPFNQHFTFLLMSVITFFVLILTYFIKNLEDDAKRDITKDKELFESLNRSYNLNS